MDAFFASVEQLDKPELRGKAIAVGGDTKRGVVAAASYEARPFGVRSAMSSITAKKLCPHLIFVSPRFERYREISGKIRNIFHRYTDLVEPLSLDEAYLDVTWNRKGNPSATLIAQEIRKQIKAETGLNASAGISINKFVAKVACDFNKPNGQKTVPPEEVEDFLEKLEIRKFHGVGKVTAEKMYRLGIFTGIDLRKKSLEFLNEHFGNSGNYYYNVVRGVHLSEVKARSERKSLSSEHTFEENISSEIFMLEHLEAISESVEKRLKRSGAAGKTVTLKIKYSDFTQQTRSRTLPSYICHKKDILFTSRELLFQEKLRNSVRLLGIGLSNFEKEEIASDADPEIEVQLKLEF